MRSPSNDTKLLRTAYPRLFVAATSAIIDLEKRSADEAVTGCQNAQIGLGDGIIDEQLDVVTTERGERRDLDNPAGR
jgi:hypothetical protein